MLCNVEAQKRHPKTLREVPQGHAHPQYWCFHQREIRINHKTQQHLQTSLATSKSAMLSDRHGNEMIAPVKAVSTSMPHKRSSPLASSQETNWWWKLGKIWYKTKAGGTKEQKLKKVHLNRSKAECAPLTYLLSDGYSGLELKGIEVTWKSFEWQKSGIALAGRHIPEQVRRAEWSFEGT